jgi:hypothetical protein
MKTFLSVACVSFLVTLLFPLATIPTEPAQDRVQDPIPVPKEGGVERRSFMRTKLNFTQNILEGLTMAEFGLIAHGIDELESVLDAEQWVTIDNEDYRQLVGEFRTAVQRLRSASETKNIEATALRFYDMSTRCIDCHQHLQRSGYSY